MLRIRYLQQWSVLYGPAMEATLHDMPEFGELAKLRVGVTRLPNKIMHLRFSHLLDKLDVTTGMPWVVGDTLQGKGLTMKRSQRWIARRAQPRTLMTGVILRY